MQTERQILKLSRSRAVQLGNSCLVFLISFTASFGKIIGFPSSVNVAVAAVSGGHIISAFMGSALSYLLYGSLTGGIVQLASILAVAAVRVFYPQGQRREPVFDAALAAGSMLLFGCVMSVAMPSDTYTASLRMINSLMCGCIVFVASTVRDRFRRSGAVDISGLNGVFIAILYIMAVSSLTALPVPILNIGRIFGTACLLLSVKRFRNIGGAVVGSLTALVFLISSLVSLVAIGVNGDTFTMFADLVVGALVFVSVPQSVLKNLLKRVVGIEGAANVAGQSTSAKLSVASRTLSSIRTQLTLVTDAIDRRSREDKLSSRVKAVVCTDCELYELCHLKNKASAEAFKALDKTANTYNSVSILDITNRLPDCIRKAYMHHSYNLLHEQMLGEKAELLRVREMRELLSQQLSTMEGMLADLSFRVGSVRSVDSGLSAAVRDHFNDLGYPNVKACVYVDNSYIRCVDIYLTASFKGDLARLTAVLSDIADCDLSLPSITEFDGMTRMSFCEEPKYELEVKSYCASSGEEYSGDSFELFSDTPYRKYIVLSDGMGTGKRARLDSMFSVSLVTRLISSGMSMETAHGLINSLLRVKGWEESFATLDIVRIDLSAVSARFLKAGAAKSLLCRDGGAGAIGGQAFPPGILNDCPPNVTEVKLFEGDTVIVFSDGVSEAAAARLAASEGDEPQPLEELVRNIGINAAVKAPGERRDDVTVIGARLVKR